MSVRARTQMARPPLLAAAALALAALAGVPGAGCYDRGSGTFVPDAEAVVPAEPAIDPAAVRARFLTDSTARVGNDTLALHPGTARFYRARAYAAAWTDPAARDSMVAALRAAEDEGIRPSDVGADLVDSLLGAGVHDDRARVDRDLLLTDGFQRLAGALLGDRIDIEQVYPHDWHVAPRTASTGESLQHALESSSPGGAVARALDLMRPRDPEYAALREALALARRDDGMPAIEWTDDLSPGDTSDVVAVLRRRLARTRDFVGPAPPDSLAPVFEPALAGALRRFQARRGLEPSGILDAGTRSALNTPGNRIVPILALNLERWRWLPAVLGETHVWVNVPSFEASLRTRDGRNWRTIRSMPVVVGQPGRWRTPVFSDTITQVVFNPTWTIPASIQLESYGRVDPRGMVRGPGPSNPLGRVKFVFPNPYGIYLHDTNARRRFQWEYRALSHGCVRVGDPRGLAQDLLARQGWDSTRVAGHLDGPWMTEPVELSHPVPIHLVYFTAEAGPGGTVYGLRDVYGWDRALASALGFSTAELEAARAALPARSGE